jgi:hypothetical protein
LEKITKVDFGLGKSGKTFIKYSCNFNKKIKRKDEKLGRK